MRYLKSEDNRYRVRFMVATEKLMDTMTVKQFISYLEENAEFEDEDYEYIGGKVVKCKAYDLKEADSNLHKEFLVTEDGRVFYWLSLNQKIELVDDEITEEMADKSKKENKGMKSREFKGLLKSEIKKAEKAANKALGVNDCKVTGYSSRVTHPIDFDPECVWVEVECEICHNYENRAEVDVHLSIPMFDRRKTDVRACAWNASEEERVYYRGYANAC